MKKGRGIIFMVLAVVLSTALYGCNGKKENEVKTPANEDTYSVVVGISQDLDSLDPHKAVAAGTKEVLFNIYEGLVKPDKDGNLVPAVAEDYQISEDGKEYTFTLRKGVLFHNGNQVTADDVVYSVERSAGLLETTEKSVVVESALSNIIKVEKVDEQTVKLHLAEGDSELIGYLTFAIVPKDYTELDRKPVGTGPFKFVSYTPLEHIVVEKNKDYYVEGVPYLDKVTFKIVANAETAIIELQGGNIDIFPYLTDSQAEQLKSKFQILEGNMNLVQALFLNNQAEVFKDSRVRQALYYGVDRQSILDFVAGGRGHIIGSNMFAGFGKYYNEDVENRYPYEPEKAKELLKEAGYENNLTFTITVPSNYAFHVDTAQVLVDQLKQIGVTVKIQTVEWAKWLSDVYVGRNYEATIIGLDAKLAARDVLDRYQSSAGNNFMNYNSPAFDEIFTKAVNTVNEEEKVAYYKELQQILAEDAASIYIQDPALLVAVNKELEGYTFYPVYVIDMSTVRYKK